LLNNLHNNLLGRINGFGLGDNGLGDDSGFVSFLEGSESVLNSNRALHFDTKIERCMSTRFLKVGVTQLISISSK
jgi:hypothetical protein